MNPNFPCLVNVKVALTFYRLFLIAENLSQPSCQISLMMSEASREAKRRSEDDEERLGERPVQVARLSSSSWSEPPLVPLATSDKVLQVMDEIRNKLERIREGRDTSTTVTQYLGLCLRTAARKARPDIFHRLLHMEGLDVNDVDMNGTTAMMLACQSGCEDFMMR